MLRNALRFAPLARALLSGATVIAAVAAPSALVAGCADESQPETWVKRLDEPAQRAPAIKRLVQFFEDAMTRANKNREDPTVKALLDKIAEPLASTYATGALDEKTRVDLIKFLADTRDPRAKAALAKACTEFGKGGNASEDDVRWAAPAIGALKLQDAAQALGEAFVKLQAGTQKGSQAYKNVHDAMLQLKSPVWKPVLLERLARPIEIPSGASDATRVAPFQNELFWQTTSAELLGELREPSAVKPLLKIVMTPAKADVAATAIMALVKIGKDAVPELVAALTGQDADLVAYAKMVSGGDPKLTTSHVRSAALVLGTIGRAEAAAPMAQVLASSESEVDRAIVARELAKIVGAPTAESTFQAAFEKISPSTTIPGGGGSDNARMELAESASRFYDPQLVPWLLKQVKDAKGGEGEKDMVQATALLSAIKLMTKAQIAEVKPVVEKEGSPLEKDAFTRASDLLGKCGDATACYLSKLQEPGSQEKATQFIGIKAAYMLGVLGNADTAREIAQQIQKVRQAAVRFAAVSAIDHLAVTAPGPVIDLLQKAVDENKSKGDANMMQADSSVGQVLYRLRAR